VCYLHEVSGELSFQQGHDSDPREDG